MKLCPCCGREVLDEIEEIKDRLPKSERIIFSRLAKRSPYAVSYQALHDALWGDYADGGPLFADKMLNIYAHRIRKKVKNRGWAVECVREVGYRLVKIKQ